MNDNGNTNEGLKLTRLRLWRAEAEAEHYRQRLLGRAGDAAAAKALERAAALEAEIRSFLALLNSDDRMDRRLANQLEVEAKIYGADDRPPAYTCPHPDDAYGAALGGK